MNIVEAFKELKEGKKIRPLKWKRENFTGTEMYVYKSRFGGAMIQAREKDDCRPFDIDSTEIEDILLGDWEIFEMTLTEKLRIDGMKYRLKDFCDKQHRHSFGCQNLDNHGCSWADCEMYKTCYKKNGYNKEQKISDGLDDWDMLDIIEAFNELKDKKAARLYRAGN